MDGTWIFKCRKCDSAFEMALTEQERAGDFARDKSCPACGLVPSDSSQAGAMRGERWHRVIGFRSRPANGAARRFVL